MHQPELIEFITSNVFKGNRPRLHASTSLTCSGGGEGGGGLESHGRELALQTNDGLGAQGDMGWSKILGAFPG